MSGHAGDAAREGLRLLGTAVAIDTVRAGDPLDVLIDPRTGLLRVLRHRPAPSSLLDLSTMTWTCNCCGDTRPDAQISVAYWKLRGFTEMFPDARCNYRYCNDRPSCATTALAGGLWPPAKEEEADA